MPDGEDTKCCIPIKKTIALVVCVLAAVALWIAHAVLDRQDEFKCDAVEVCNDLKLPGEAEAASPDRMKHEFQSYYLGGRTCPWFSELKTRCSLPTHGDLCFDDVNWRDRAGHGCEWWTKHVSDSTYSARQTGENEKCNKSPYNEDRTPHYDYRGNNTMTEAELRNMKHACCVCGAHRDYRNYAGSLDHRLPGKFPDVPVPAHHRGQTPTHLTQCCACNNTDKWKRGGAWKCPHVTEGRVQFEDLGEVNPVTAQIFISAIVLSVCSALLCCVWASSTVRNTFMKTESQYQLQL